jgi:hypothetical protein
MTIFFMAFPPLELCENIVLKQAPHDPALVRPSKSMRDPLILKPQLPAFVLCERKPSGVVTTSMALVASMGRPIASGFLAVAILSLLPSGCVFTTRSVAGCWRWRARSQYHSFISCVWGTSPVHALRIIGFLIVVGAASWQSSIHSMRKPATR